MIVCSCTVFGDHQARSVIAKDARRPRMSEVYAGLGCSAQCGRCAHTIKRIMGEMTNCAIGPLPQCEPARCRNNESSGKPFP